MSDDPLAMRAAGGVPWRWGTDGKVEVLLVHRPRYDDWTFPKGKVKDGESDDEAAIREVQEETGLRCPLGNELATTRYTHRQGRQKVVRYWAMGPVAEGPRAQNEIDEVTWFTSEQAAVRLSYERDVEVLRSLEAILEPR
jgi:8-oxo-dGTP pyrophosphatase MutT (NUDIX family)